MLVLEDEENRDDDQDRREYLAQQDPDGGTGADRGPQAAQRVRRRYRDEDDDDRCAQRRLQAVEGRPRQSLVDQGGAVVVPLEMARDEPRVDRGQFPLALERHRQQPQQREAQEDKVAAESQVL